MMFSTPESFKVLVAALGVLLLLEHPVRADVIPLSFITINDTLPNDSVQISLGGLFTAFGVSSNCTKTGTGASGTATCASEALPIILTVDGPGPLGSGTNTINVNFWETPAHTVLSDTLAITASTNADGSAHGVLTFQSDVEGGPALIPLTGIEGSTLFTFDETTAGTTLSALFGPNSGNPTQITMMSDVSEVPETSSLLLVGTSLVGLVLLKRLRTRTDHS
jgi:hypothetical protein